jgi:F-type H+-transporting ATPase subunit a
VSTLTPDELVILRVGPLAINATMAFTWVVMILLVLGAWLITRRLSTGPQIPRWQGVIEVLVGYLRSETRALAGRRGDAILPFVGALGLFIAVSNALSVVPGFEPPTSSLSTTTALALAVFVAVPAYGIASIGMRGYLRRYVEPTPLMLPFHVISEVSRTLALAVRLFGNVMSGVKIVAILLSLVPFVFPLVLSALGLLTGLIQAYIFAILAAVFISSGIRSYGVDADEDRRAASSDASEDPGAGHEPREKE